MEKIAKNKKTWVSQIDFILKYFSWLTVFALIVLVIVRKTGLWMPPEWVSVWLVPILTAGAVGYLTNWIAIWMLFKPYDQKLGFIQGVIPSKKEELGKELGQVIPEYLLKPEELSEEIGKIVKNYLQNPNLLEDVRTKVNAFLKKYGGTVADFLIPYIESALQKALRDNMTPERLSGIYDSVVVKWFSDEEKRTMIADAIVSELQSRNKEIADILRSQIKAGTVTYVRERHPILSTLLSLDSFAAGLVDSFDWNYISSKIKEKLSEAETRELISGELTKITLKLKNWLQSPDAQEKLGAFLSEKRGEMEIFLKEYLVENLPDMVNNCLKQDDFWDAVQTKLLPMLQDYILHRLKKEKEKIISGFNIPGKIEKSVKEMDMKMLHEMILRASDNNLTLIQVLGYGLGAVCGILLIFAS